MNESGPESLPVPSLFEAVVGQDRAVAALRAAAAHPVHAYLFLGKAGAGGRAAARAFAAALLCPRGGCGECDACRTALLGTHPDLVEVERTGAALDVEDARRLGALSLRRPLVAARQVLVVADAHLAIRSAPALLKTLEEPPTSTVFVLLAEDVPPELVTVASRCVEIPFPPAPAAAVASWLVARGVEEDQARLVAEGAGGDVERARLLAEDPDFAARLALWRSVPSRLDGDGAIAAALAREVLASTERAVAPLRAEQERELEALAASAEAMGERGVPGRRDVVDRHHREERRWRTDELRIGFGVLARVYRDRLAEAAQAGPRPVGGAEAADPADAAKRAGEAVDLINGTSEALRHNANETLLLESLFVRLGRLAG